MAYTCSWWGHKMKYVIIGCRYLLGRIPIFQNRKKERCEFIPQLKFPHTSTIKEKQNALSLFPSLLPQHFTNSSNFFPYRTQTNWQELQIEMVELSSS